MKAFILVFLILTWPCISENIPSAGMDHQGFPQESPLFKGSSLDEEGDLKVKKEAYDEMGFDKKFIIKKTVQNHFMLNTLVVENSIPSLGKIKGGSTSVFLNSIVEVRVMNGGVKVDDILSVYKDLGSVKHATSHDEVGSFVHIVGEIKITKEVGGGFLALVTKVFDDIKSDDLVTTIKPEDIRVKPKAMPQRIEGAIASFFSAGHLQFSLGSIGVLDKGKNASLEPGFVFNVLSKDGKKEDAEEDNSLIKTVGEIMVVTVGEKVATFIVTKSSIPLQPGMKVEGKM